MYRPNHLKAKLRKGENPIGCWLGLDSPAAAELLALVGYDALLIDMEHGPSDIASATRQMQAMSALPATSIVRVPWNDAVVIKRVLDAGAESVMIPSINTVEEARDAVAACHYPPKGIRGAAYSLVRASNYGLDAAQYGEDDGKELLVMCQIESIKAVDNIEAICKVAGIDLLFIGPLDLSASIGRKGDYQNPEFVQALEHVESVVTESDKWLGGLCLSGDTPAKMFKRGYDYVMPGSDVILLRDAAKANLEEALKNEVL